MTVYHFIAAKRKRYAKTDYTHRKKKSILCNTPVKCVFGERVFDLMKKPLDFLI